MTSPAPLRRRSESRLSAQELFDRILGSAVDWPGKTVRLERHSASEYRQRTSSPSVSVAELYHENSKLYLEKVAELDVTRVDASEVRRAFVERRAAVVALRGEAPDLDGPWRRLLSPDGLELPAELFYAVELRVLDGDVLYVHEPVSGRLDVAKRLLPAEVATVRAALALLDDPDPPLPDVPIVFVVASLARNDLLYGARGYRRTLMEAGRVVHGITRRAEMLDVPADVVYEFVDRDVDTALEVDGIEQATLVAIGIGRNGANG